MALDQKIQDFLSGECNFGARPVDPKYTCLKKICVVLLWNDTAVGIEWPLHLLDEGPLLAAKDVAALTFAQSRFEG